jgi:TRAP-type C4-dicarboxylate transport system permease small subunit
MTLKEKFDIFLSVVGEVLWRGFGIFLFILGGAAGSGAVITGDPMTGVLIAWVTLMLGVVGAVGYAIATTGRATKKTVSDAANDAVKKFEEDPKK